MNDCKVCYLPDQFKLIIINICFKALCKPYRFHNKNKEKIICNKSELLVRGKIINLN